MTDIDQFENAVIARRVASRVKSAADADTEVWLNVGSDQVEVAVVGIDNRIIQSVESELRFEAEDFGATVEDENPRDLKTPGDMAYMGFTAAADEEEMAISFQDLVKHLTKAAKRHSWVGEVRVGRGWPDRDRWTAVWIRGLKELTGPANVDVEQGPRNDILVTFYVESPYWEGGLSSQERALNKILTQLSREIGAVHGANQYEVGEDDYRGIQVRVDDTARANAMSNRMPRLVRTLRTLQRQADDVAKLMGDKLKKIKDEAVKELENAAAHVTLNKGPEATSDLEKMDRVVSKWRGKFEWSGLSSEAYQEITDALTEISDRIEEVTREIDDNGWLDADPDLEEAVMEFMENDGLPSIESLIQDLDRL